VKIPIPKAQSQYTDTSTGVPTYPFFQYLLNLEDRVTSLEDSGGSVTPPSGPYLPITSTVTGNNSVVTYGSLAQGLVLVTLDGDVDVPGPSQYYGSDITLTKGWYSISEAFASSSTITKSVDADGITSFTTVSQGILPVVTGEVPPVFVYIDDGSLVYTEIF